MSNLKKLYLPFDTLLLTHYKKIWNQTRSAQETAKCNLEG